MNVARRFSLLYRNTIKWLFMFFCVIGDQIEWLRQPSRRLIRHAFGDGAADWGWAIGAHQHGRTGFCSLTTRLSVLLRPARGRPCGTAHWHIVAIAATVLAIDGFLPSHKVAMAQVMEQNPAPLMFGDQNPAFGTAPLEIDEDDTPLGVALTNLKVVNTTPEDAWKSGGVDLSEAGPTLQTPAARETLREFVGEPLSQKQLSEIRAAVVRQYRASDHPFVKVVIPPQDVSGGTLRVEVIEYRVGQVMVEGNDWTDETHVEQTAGLEQGAPITASDLVQNLNWLNLNPYRNLGAVFEPGTVPGTTDIILRAEERKPWSVYAGYANTGTPSTGRNRVFAGFNLANLPFLDHQLSYKFAANPDSLHSGDWIGVDRVPGYVSHAASYFAPLDFGDAGRAKLRVSAGYAESGTELYDSIYEFGESWSLTSELAVPLDLPSFIAFDLFAGVDVKRQTTTLEFYGEPFLETASGVGQLRGGLRAMGRYSLGSVSNDVTVEASLTGSPGGVMPDSTDYVYFQASVHQTSRWDNGFGVSVAVGGQASNDVLPSLEKFTVGGTSGLRGYETNELAGNSGLQGSVEVLVPSVTARPFDFRLSAQPYGFFDGAFVMDDTRDDQGARSIGAGLKLSADRYASATIEAGYALDDGPQTDAGAASVMGTVVVRY